MSGEAVELEVINIQTQEEDTDRLTYKGAGTLYHKKGKYYLIYEEEGEGLEGARTTVKIDPRQERVFLNRKGPAALNQEFVEGKVNHDSYQTDQGNLEIKTETKKLSIKAGKEQGKIKIKYDLYLAGGFFAANDLEITYQLKA